MTAALQPPAGVATTNADTALEFFRLLSAKNITAWADLWHPDAVIAVPYPPTGFPPAIRGKDQIVTGFHTLFANFKTFKATPTALYPATNPDAVCIEYRNTATLTTGAEYDNDNIAVFRFEDGLITEYHDYFDPRRFQTVVDALPQGQDVGDGSVHE